MRAVDGSRSKGAEVCELAALSGGRGRRRAIALD